MKWENNSRMDVYEFLEFVVVIDVVFGVWMLGGEYVLWDVLFFEI